MFKNISIVILILLISVSSSLDTQAIFKLDYKREKDVEIKDYNSTVDNFLSSNKLDFNLPNVIRRDYSLDNYDLISPHINYSKNIRGVYVSEWLAVNKRKINDLMKEVEESNLNAIVIDLKDVRGRITFSKNQEDPSQFFERGLKELVDRAHKQGIYVIGRLAVFKDASLLKRDSNYALKYISASDNKTIINSTKWTSPYSKEVWRYNLRIAEEATKLGIDEIQFDYIRFPTLALNSELIIKEDDDKSKADVIVEFLKFAKKRLDKYNILISVDVFGLTTTVKGDLKIGQDITRMIKYVDYLSPMIYPSHYSPGFYGIDNPDSNPYDIIFRSLRDARKKLGEDSYKLRPWLQDFSLKHSYKNKEIREQIKAVRDNQVSSWLLWNPRSVYTISAVKDNQKGRKDRWSLQGSELFQKE